MSVEAAAAPAETKPASPVQSSPKVGEGSSPPRPRRPTGGFEAFDQDVLDKFLRETLKAEPSALGADAPPAPPAKATQAQTAEPWWLDPMALRPQPPRRSLDKTDQDASTSAPAPASASMKAGDFGIRLDTSNLSPTSYAPPWQKRLELSPASPKHVRLGGKSPIDGPRPVRTAGLLKPGDAPSSPATLRSRKSSAVGTLMPSSDSSRRSSAGPKLRRSSSWGALTSRKNSVAPDLGPDLDYLQLAKRTAHVARVAGYAWRLSYLDKLERLIQVELSVQEAEAIVTIGRIADDRQALSRAVSRVSLPNASMTALPHFVDEPVQHRLGRRRIRSSSAAGFVKSLLHRISRKDQELDLDDELSVPAPKQRHVFGTALSQVPDNGFLSTIIGGQRHDIPLVVFAAVEEIYARGMSVPRLFRIAGDSIRVRELANAYDSPPEYGELINLHSERIHTVSSLLKKYLRELPEPVVDERLLRLWFRVTLDDSLGVKRVPCAQLLLRLLPTPNFSLLVYLAAFLSQAPLYHDNNLTLDSVAIIFGPALMGTRLTPVRKGETARPNACEAIKKAQDSLAWLLKNWTAVAHGLLDPNFDVNVDELLAYPPATKFSFPKPPDHRKAADSVSTHGDTTDLTMTADSELSRRGSDDTTPPTSVDDPAAESKSQLSPSATRVTVLVENGSERREKLEAARDTALRDAEDARSELATLRHALSQDDAGADVALLRVELEKAKAENATLREEQRKDARKIDSLQRQLDSIRSILSSRRRSSALSE